MAGMGNSRRAWAPGAGFLRIAGWLSMAIVGLSWLAAGGAAAQERAPAGQVATKLPLKQIDIGFVRHGFGTWTAKISSGALDLATGRSMRWAAYDADRDALEAMEGGRLDIALVGTGVVAAAVTRGFDLKIFYVLGAAADGEGMVVHAGGDASSFADPKSLVSKVIAVPFDSAPHLRLLESVRRWGLGLPSMRIANLKTTQIEQAWKRGEIDAAVVSDPLYGRLSRHGYPMPLPAARENTGALVFVAPAEFVARHVVFLSRFTDVLARADTAFAAKSGPISEDNAAVRSIAAATGLTPAEVLGSLMRYRSPPLEAQASAQWLGGGAGSALVHALKADADTWRWSARLTGPQVDMSTVPTPEPVMMALSYKR